ncbi:MAG: GatB/YqeY domain-containing protein [Gammaproteobacteria bacterium]|nr:GatB/YqeY domain-containing protein [Gammaproteobacteria bacterium]
MSLKSRLETDMKAALKARDTEKLGVIRMALAAVKQREIDSDSRDGLSDTEAFGVIERMIKQRHEAADQFRAGGREESAQKEEREAKLLGEYLPEPVDSETLDAEIAGVVRETGAASRRDMGKVMGLLKARLAGRADMGEVSRRVREKLGD